MDKQWRPKNWNNPYKETTINDFGLGGQEVYGWEHKVFEEGADAMLNALWKLAEESPTKTFTIDSRVVNIFEADNERR